jgi:hypothetical protein
MTNINIHFNIKHIFDIIFIIYTRKYNTTGGYYFARP